jgi:hypothetical protein
MNMTREQALQVILSIAKDTKEDAQRRVIASRYLHEYGESRVAAEVLLSIVRDGYGKEEDQFDAAGELWKMEEIANAIRAYAAISSRLRGNNERQKVAEQAISSIQQGEPAPGSPYPGGRGWVEEGVFRVMPAPVPVFEEDEEAPEPLK